MEIETKVCVSCKCETLASNFEDGEDRCILCDVDFEPCGGCGNSDPREVCLGCRHPFKAIINQRHPCIGTEKGGVK